MARVDVLGVGVDPVDLAQVFARVAVSVARRIPLTVSYANVHVIEVASRDPQLRAFLAATDLCICDGNGVRLGARLLGTGDLPARMTGADWIWDLAAEAARQGWSLHWIGGRPGVTDRAADALRRRNPTLKVTTDHGYHPKDGPDDDAVLERIAALAPDIVLVGMGTPIQEHWVAQRRDRIQAPVVWVLGATADFLAGEVARGPAWLVRDHEWLSRLVHDPRRMAPRYFLENPRFLARIVAARLTAGARPPTR